MTMSLEIYKCEACGAIVEVLQGGAGELVCCTQPMRLFVENGVDASKEKHVPVIEKTAAGVKVTIGSIPHPMEEKHWIQWIELQVGKQILRQSLKPGETPSAFFAGIRPDVTVVAREYCNLHGLWKV
jgi:superoxide reductase